MLTWKSRIALMFVIIIVYATWIMSGIVFDYYHDCELNDESILRVKKLDDGNVEIKVALTTVTSPDNVMEAIITLAENITTELAAIASDMTAETVDASR